VAGKGEHPGGAHKLLGCLVLLGPFVCVYRARGQNLVSFCGDPSHLTPENLTGSGGLGSWMTTLTLSQAHEVRAASLLCCALLRSIPAGASELQIS
jgi:hypothetical protein